MCFGRTDLEMRQIRFSTLTSLNSQSNHSARPSLDIEVLAPSVAIFPTRGAHGQVHVPHLSLAVNGLASDRLRLCLLSPAHAGGDSGGIDFFLRGARSQTRFLRLI